MVNTRITLLVYSVLLMSTVHNALLPAHFTRNLWRSIPRTAKINAQCVALGAVIFGVPAVVGGLRLAQQRRIQQLQDSAQALSETHPRTQPVGIVNLYGTCYMSAAMQLLEAAHAAQPKSILPVLCTAQSGLLAAYKKTRRTPYRACTELYSGSIDPAPLVEEWTCQAPGEALYGTWVQKNHKGSDGTSTVHELYPALAVQAVGGNSEHICTRIIEEMAGVAAQIEQPLPIALADFVEQIEQPSPIALAEVAGVYDVLGLYKSCPLLIIYNTKRFQFSPLLTITIEEELYRIAAVVQYRVALPPETDSSRAFQAELASHAICYARYGDHWFKCDDHMVEPMSEAEVLAELHDDAHTTYSGRAKILGLGIVNPHPALVLYSKQSATYGHDVDDVPLSFRSVSDPSSSIA